MQLELWKKVAAKLNQQLEFLGVRRLDTAFLRLRDGRSRKAVISPSRKALRVDRRAPKQPYTRPMEAKAVIAAQPSATPSTMPARTSLRKCIPRTMRETAMLMARKNNAPSSEG